MTRKSKLSAVVGLGMLVFVSYPVVLYGYGPQDWIDCLFTTGQHGTDYAGGYSASAFARVKPGMTPEEVGAILGRPLNRKVWSDWGMQDWEYALPATSSGQLEFDGSTPPS